MNLRKNLGRVASTIVATALLASVATVPAFAVGVNGTGASENEVTQIPVTKTITTDGNTYAPNTTFKFKVDEGAAGTLEDGEQTRPVIAGVAGGLGTVDTDGKYYFTIVSTPDEDGELSGSFKFDGNIIVNNYVFDNVAPGIYHYTAQEVAGNYDGIDYDTTTSFDIYVYVMVDEGENYVGYVVTTNANTPTAAGKAELAFKNDYGKDNDGTHDVLIKKIVAGDQGDQNTGEFKFDVKVDGADDELYKVVVDYDSTTENAGKDSTIVLTSGTAQEVTLKHNGTIHIYGLSETDKYTVTEKNTTTQGSGAVVTNDGYTVTDTDNAEGSPDGTVTGTTSSDVQNDTPTHTITNTRSTTTPTGIVMNVAPYALLVVVAVAGCFVFLRKRNED